MEQQVFICDREQCGYQSHYNALVAMRERRKPRLVVRLTVGFAGVLVLSGIIMLLRYFADVSGAYAYLALLGLLGSFIWNTRGQEELTCLICRQAQMIPGNTERGQYLMRVAWNKVHKEG